MCVCFLFSQVFGMELNLSKNVISCGDQGKALLPTSNVIVEPVSGQ